jgi:outer membrane protein assembly factor BamB
VRGYHPETTVWSSPAVAVVGGRAVLFVGSYDRNLYALDVATGRERWRFTAGASIRSAPAVARVGGRIVVFFGADDRTFYAVDAQTHRKLWAREVRPWQPTVGRAMLTAPVVFDRQPSRPSPPDPPSQSWERGREAVLFGYWIYDRSLSHAVQRAGVRAYAAATGDLLWERELGQSEPTQPALAYLHGRPLVFLATRDGNVHALDAATGRTLWEYTCCSDVASSPVVLPGEPMRIALGTRFGYVHALDARTGRECWSFKAAHWVDSTPAAAEVKGRSLLFFGSQDQSVYALASDSGRLVWRFATKGDVYSSPAILRHQGQTFVAAASGDDGLYLLDAATGRERWRTTPGHFLWGYRVVGDSVWASPMGVRLQASSLTASRGITMLIAPFYDGVVHAYRLDEAAPNLARDVSSGYGRQMLRYVAFTVLGTLLAVLYVTGAGHALLRQMWQRKRRA